MIDLWRIRPSMSWADDPYDNAFAESFWSRLKAELLEGGAFLSVEDARIEIFDYIEAVRRCGVLQSSATALVAGLPKP